MKHLIAATMMTTTLAFAAPAMAQDELDFIDEFQGYLDISESMLDLVNRKEAAVFFAVEGIVEIHEDRGEQAKAIPALNGILDQYPDNRAVRNIVRLKLRDLYRETGQTDLALAELATIIEENK